MNITDIQANRSLLFSNISWNSYKFQLQNRIHSANLHQYYLLTDEEIHAIQNTIRLNVGTTPYYMSLSDPTDPNCPIRRMIVPSVGETILSPEELPDPLHEERLSPVKGLTKMYKDRALLFSNYECAVYCRHCMRGRKVSYSDERMSVDDLAACMEYLQQDTDISDVVISGGDPLNLSDTKLNFILESLEKIPHIKICRIGTRNPVTLPMRITNDLCKILELHNTDRLSIFCNTQFNHSKECTPESKEAIFKILKCGISVGNQAVLLKGINDTGEEMLALHKKLLEMRIRAYYIYDPELIPGSKHFRTPLYKGIEIVKYMRGKISGMGIPQFVNDLPGGGGNILLSCGWYIGYPKETRTHVFQSAAHGTYHFSYEPEDSTYIDKYKPISEDVWIKIRDISVKNL